MSDDRTLDRRKHPAHGIMFTPNVPTIIFLTVATKDRKPWLASTQVHDLLRAVWTESDAWLAGRYVVMPDHIHLFASPASTDVPFDNWVRYWKSQFTKRHRVRTHHWHTDHWDTRLRRDESYASKWEYVRDNPIRKGMVDRAEDWPYQGEIHVLPW